MKPSLAFALISLLPFAMPPFAGKVVGVSDGDTIKVMRDGGGLDAVQDM